MANTSGLPVPIIENWDWQLRAACRNLDSAAFFPPERERGNERRRREAVAKQVCSGCPVIEQCRRHALAAEERYGVWGGLTETDRTAVIRARRAAARLPPSD
jgi:WhiB family redox-sensing transcriptional regulator